MAKYELRLPARFPAMRRRRGGVEIPRGRSIVVDLDKEQLAAIKDDDVIIVRKVTESKANKTSKASTSSKKGS